MADNNIIRIKRRLYAGGTGAPSTLYNAELAYNEFDDKLFIGYGDNGSGVATSIIPIAGAGKFVTLDTTQTISGAKTFTNIVYLTDSSNQIAVSSSGITLYNTTSGGGTGTGIYLHAASGHINIETGENDNINLITSTGDAYLNSYRILTTLDLGSISITGDLNMNGYNIINGNDITVQGTIYGSTGILYLDPYPADSPLNYSPKPTGEVVILGDLRVEGTTTTVNSTEVTIEDKTFVLASTAAVESDLDGAGVFFGDPNASPTFANYKSITWDQSNTRISVNDDFNVQGDITLTGTVDGVDIASIAYFKTITSTSNTTSYTGGGSINAANIDDTLNINAGIGLDIQASTDIVGIALSHLGIEDLVDPNADRIMFWDDSVGSTAWLSAGTGLTLSGTTLSNSDRGSSQLIFKNIAAENSAGTPHGTAVADNNNDTLHLREVQVDTTNGIALSYTADDIIGISHANTSSVANNTNTNGVVIQSLTFDTYGHVLTWGEIDLDSRYYTETEVDNTFLKLDGSNDPMTGDLNMGANNIWFGASNEAQIYYSGGVLYLDANDDTSPYTSKVVAQGRFSATADIYDTVLTNCTIDGGSF